MLARPSWCRTGTDLHYKELTPQLAGREKYLTGIQQTFPSTTLDLMQQHH